MFSALITPTHLPSPQLPHPHLVHFPLLLILTPFFTKQTNPLSLSLNSFSQAKVVSYSGEKMSDMKTKVNVHSKLTVVSDTPVQPGKIYPLSPLDHAMGLHTLHIIFYYPYDRSDRSGLSDLGRLRESLSEVLSSYPPVTGRLKKGEDGNWLIKCNDAGVRILKAKVNCSLDEWLRSADGSEERDLTVWEDMPEDYNIWSPFRIQLNDFEGGGLAISLSCPHMHADPNCATVLMKSWTELYRRQCIAHAPFFHPPGLRGRPTPNIDPKTDKFYATKSKTDSIQTKPTVKMSTATFKFSETMIKKHLTEIQTKYPNATPFDMLTALFWLSVTNAKHTLTDQKQESSKISICIEFRKLLHAPLPHGFFGNALHFSEVCSDVEEMEKGGLEFVTGVVHGHCSSLTEEDYWSAIDWFESQKDEGGKFKEPFQMYGPELTSANMEHVFAYGAVLEDKKPVHVSYHVGNVEGEGLIMVLPSLEDGLGRTVMVTLPEDQVAMVCRDVDILRFEPTLVVSGVTTGSL